MSHFKEKWSGWPSSLRVRLKLGSLKEGVSSNLTSNNLYNFQHMKFCGKFMHMKNY